MLTFGGMELVVVVFTPAWWSDVGGVSIYPEVIALRVPINTETHPKANHLTERWEVT